MSKRKKRLGEILVDANVLSLAQLNIALERMKFSKLRLGEQLVKLKICTEKDIVSALAQQLRIPIVELKNLEFDDTVFSVVPRSFAVECNGIPFKIEGKFIHIAFADPLRLDVIQNLEAKIQRSIKKYIASQSEIDWAIEEKYVEDDSAQEIMDNLDNMGGLEMEAISDMTIEDFIPDQDTMEDDEFSAVELQRAAADKSVINAVNQIIRICVVNRASDIHLEPQRKILLIRQRIDGILQEMAKLPRSITPAIISRIKVIAALDIAEKRIPQDGKVRATLSKGHEVDLRVSTLPTKYGEKVVIRILDQSKSSLDLDKIFFDPGELEKIMAVIKASQGMILVTGPTGSGKTTTLYSIIQHLKSPTSNIVTIEDPIEYELEGVNQVQVNHQIGLSFAKILRSILRQDPEIILVGEIRDNETAEVAFQAAQTGHLVLSTLHTNSTYATITRLLDIGVDPPIAASSLQGILAQRLVRKICSECREEYAPDEETITRYSFPSGTKLCKGKGCERCNYTGYRGRLSVIEIMTMTPDLRAAIMESKPEHVIKSIAIKNGMELIFEIGKKYVMQGLTTISELRRVLETVEDGVGTDATAELPDSEMIDSQRQEIPNSASMPASTDVLECPNCSEKVNAKWKVCPFCGNSLVQKTVLKNCRECNEEISPKWKICPNCGSNLEIQRKALEDGENALEEPVMAQPPGGPPSALGRPLDMMTIQGAPRVLVVDDQKSMQKLVSIALKGIECKVDTAGDGVQALEKVRRFQPHLIILDIVMPKMDGFEVCRRLRADVRTAFIPIIMLTSLADEKSRLKGYVAGTDDYLSKPFILEEFYTRVRNLLRRTYGYYSPDDELLGIGQEWDASTEEARARQKMIDHRDRLDRIEETTADEAEED